MASTRHASGRPNGTKTGMTSGLDLQIPQVQFLPKPILHSFRVLAEASATPAMAALQGLTAAGKDLTDAVQENCAGATESLEEYSLAAIELARNNMRLAFELAGAPSDHKSISDVISVSRVQTKRQFDALVTMQVGLWRLASKLTTRTINPLLEGANPSDRR